MIERNKAIIQTNKQRKLKQDIRQKDRRKTMIALITIAVLLFIVGIIYVILPIDIMPFIPIDDIIFIVITIIFATPFLIISSSKKQPINKKSKCKTCGHEANGFRLCKACFYEELNKSNNKRYLTKTGKTVKSKSELLLDEHLFNKGYTYTYEEELPLKDENGYTIYLHPDFCIYDGDDRIFIEHWGFNEKNKKYTDRKKDKLKLYHLNGITLINLYESTDGEQLREALDKKLLNYEKGKINY